MIYIDPSTSSLDLYIEKHQAPENQVNIEITYSLDSSIIINSSYVTVHENYYIYNLDASSLRPGQYQYQIIDSSSLNAYESGLLYKLSDYQANKNITENIVYERD